MDQPAAETPIAVLERMDVNETQCRRRSAAVDSILTEMQRRALTGQSAIDVVWLALGGYRRKNLLPFSDSRVLFAFADDQAQEQNEDTVRALLAGLF